MNANHPTRSAEEMQAELEQLKAELRTAKLQLNAMRTAAVRTQQNIDRAIAISESYSQSKLVRLSAGLRNLRYGHFSKDPAIREAFREGNIRLEDDFSPMAQVLSALHQCNVELPAGVLTEADLSQPENHPQLLRRLREPYNKFDVLIFGIIDYDYRYQRPQQIADHFAAEGHRVFYINSTFHKGSGYLLHEKKDNLYIVDLPNANHDVIYTTAPTDPHCETAKALDALLLNHCIRDALMVADYPNWVHLLLHLRQRMGFPLVTDYMDDFDGFEGSSLVAQSCELLLKESDFVAASSLYLMDKAKRHTAEPVLIRNGTEFNHFNTAYREQANERKVIGYYGAIAHWFDFGMAEALSARFPDCDIVLIGDVSAGEDRLKKLPNVKLLGEKPYAILPQYLKDFDVCLIPFDASIDLIKATNPVKFYEYLSAGKKIVATEIPELEPFRDRYVYLANDRDAFCDYVELCLNGTDTLASPADCMAFAADNDWACRVRSFSTEARKCFPTVNIVADATMADHIRSVTAYPNYSLGASFDADYTAVVRKDTRLSRGWLTGLLKHFRTSDVSMVCAVPTQTQNPVDVYLRETFANGCGICTDTPETDCFVVYNRGTSAEKSVVYAENVITAKL